jgi:hypothetical protein
MIPALAFANVAADVHLLASEDVALKTDSQDTVAGQKRSARDAEVDERDAAKGKRCRGDEGESRRPPRQKPLLMRHLQSPCRSRKTKPPLRSA